LRVDAIDSVQLSDAVFDFSCTGRAIHLWDRELCNISLVYRWGNLIILFSCVLGVLVTLVIVVMCMTLLVRILFMVVGLIRWFTTSVVGFLVR
jgi:hypothetical protein